MVRYFAGGIKNDDASAIGFARLVSNGCDINPIVNGFPTLRIIEWLVVIEYRKRILIILMSIRLHRI